MNEAQFEEPSRTLSFEMATTRQGALVPARSKWILTFIVLALVILAARWYYVEQFAVALPYWDQWDAEWAYLLKPWTEGTLRWSDLWSAHNEHRIFPTRLLVLLCFELTGTWNNLYEARLNVPLGASTSLLLIWLLHKAGELYGVRWLVVAVILAGASLPFSWENLLIGFQSQFYFINLFTLASLALVAYRPHKIWTMALLGILSLLSILTLASGLLTPLAVGAVYMVQALQQGKLTPRAGGMVFGLGLLAALAYWSMPYVPLHQALRARSITEFLEATLLIMGWPLRGSKWYIGLMWVPSLVYLPLLLRRRSPLSPTDFLMLGCWVWTALQILALAYGRGHDLRHLTSRYTEVLLLGLAANSWIVIRAPEVLGQKTAVRWVLRSVAFLFLAGVLISYGQRTKHDFTIMQNERANRLQQTKQVEAYLMSGDPAVLHNPERQIPYPDPRRLQRFLDDPALRKVLYRN